MPLDSDSAASTSTRGGVEFDQLCTGAVQYYSFNLVKLIAPNLKTATDIKKKLITKLDDTITALEIGSDRKIAKFYVGKTYVPRRHIQGGKFMQFDPLNHNTWIKKGISSRWGIHKREDYGRDGMVVLCAITSNTVPMKAMHQEDFTLDMEQHLLCHYRNDPRLANSTLNTGQKASTYYAYAIYMAFAYEEKDSDEEDSNEEKDSNEEEDSTEEEKDSDEEEDDNEGITWITVLLRRQHPMVSS